METVEYANICVHEAVASLHPAWSILLFQSMFTTNDPAVQEKDPWVVVGLMKQRLLYREEEYRRRVQQYEKRIDAESVKEVSNAVH